ncbi:supervillin a isoform X11 [Micropterus dolomieu]|uniref:supervillin a isoform X11 n=1 Tax=Micropterus dolomieu TaxID=147949 RepID=UPI001E8DE387|nr:supervillin a isoform X11 [Micropterus dolomieu]
MYRNPWISNYLTHVKFCSQGLGSETPIKLSNPRLLQKRALSFQKEFFDEKDDPAKSTKDIDVSVLANLPKVSELRKRFEGISTSTSDWEMNRKERIARRLEGIEGEMHPSLLPSLVANRLLEEDTPRYTRASDPCEPCGVTVQRYGIEGFESAGMQLTAPERQSRARCRPEPQSAIHTEPLYSSGPTTSAPELESKAERIARYKAERRRQLAERYGISLDQEPDLDCPSSYTSTRKEVEGFGRQKGEFVGEEGKDITVSSSATSPRAGRTAPQHGHPNLGYEMGRIRVDSFSERERLMNLENQRRAAEPPSSSSYMDVTSLSSAARVPAKDSSVTGMPPTSPKLSRHPSLSPPKHGVSRGDLFIEQQAHNVLSRQGEVMGERALAGYEAPWRGEKDRGRRPRQYICPGDGRKTSERFRTQPITSAERQETDRSCVSSDLASTEADEEKLDERAKLSVAAKRSLFRELEKSIDGGAPKPRSRNAAVDRRLRRTQDRSRTQPVTTEEVVIAATVPTHVPQTVTVHTAVARAPSPTSTVLPYRLQASSQQSAAARKQAWEARQVQDTQEVQGPKPVSAVEGKDQSQSQIQDQEEPDLCTLSLAEKMALFNRLSQPPTRVTRTRGDSRQRRANTRYQTQPITLEDMEQEASDIDVRDELELCDSPVEHLQLHNGTGSRFGHLHTSSSSSALRAGSTVSTDHAGDIHITRAAARVEPLPTSSGSSLPPRHDLALMSQDSVDQQRSGIFSHREDGADLGGGKRKLYSPEGVVRQAALPQPQTGRERSGEEEEEEQWLARGAGDRAMQSSESHMVQARQEAYLSEEGHCPESQKNSAIIGELLEPTVVASRAASGSPRSVCQPPVADTHINGSGPPAGLVQPEHEDELNDMMTARHMSIKQRVALLKMSGEQDWRNRINKKQDVVKVAVDEQHAQLWEAEQSFKTKDDEALMIIDEFAVSDQLWEPVFPSTFSPPPEPPFTSSPDVSASQATRSPRPMQVDERHPWRRKRIAEAEMECQGIECHMSIQERKQLIVAQEESWKMKGHGAANDSTQFTVAARMVKKGLASPSALQCPVSSKPKNSSLAISKPQEEIKAIPDLNLESDMKLDKLESFLGKLNSKVSGLPEATITVTEKKVKEVMNLEDETFTKFYRQVEELPVTTNRMEIEDDFDAIFGPQVPKLTSEMVQHKRAVRPARNVQSSRNPLKILAAREDIRHEYTEERLNIGLLESKRMKAEKLNKNSGFSDVALAGLASKENFSNINLRSVNISEQMSNNSAVPYKKLMLLQVKGQLT